MKTNMPVAIFKSLNLEDFQQICIKKGVSFASYRLPNTSDIYTIVQTKDNSEPAITIDNHSKGFVFAPFNDSKKHKTIIIKTDHCFVNSEIPDELHNWIENMTESTVQKQERNVSTSKEAYEKNVENAVSAIKRKDFEKIVISKIHCMDIPDGFSPTMLFGKLTAKYSHAFVYILHTPATGLWMGASPEPLLEMDSINYKTISLAGTQLALSVDIDSYNWSEKEIDEQKIVTNFIENTLLKAGITDLIKSPTANYRAANLIHLKTEFTFPVSQQKTLTELIDVLHPTPSVGGLPKKLACSFILNTELHDREYYTGYLGVMNCNTQTHLYVNLRCMKVTSEQIILFSGAGITAGSDPLKEWFETENKLMTLKQVIFDENI